MSAVSYQKWHVRPSSKCTDTRTNLLKAMVSLHGNWYAFQCAIKTLHVKVLLKPGIDNFLGFNKGWTCYTGHYLILLNIFQLVLYVQTKGFPTEVETVHLLLFPMENVTDNRWISAMCFNKVCCCYKTALSKRRKNCCALTLLSLAWWLLMHDHIKTLCFKPPMPFSKFRQYALCFGLSFQC